MCTNRYFFRAEKRAAIPSAQPALVLPSAASQMKSNLFLGVTSHTCLTAIKLFQGKILDTLFCIQSVLGGTTEVGVYWGHNLLQTCTISSCSFLSALPAQTLRGNDGEELGFLDELLLIYYVYLQDTRLPSINRPWAPPVHFNHLHKI